MKRSRFREEQVIGILRRAQAESSVETLCAAHNISTPIYHAWKRQYGGMEVNETLRIHKDVDSKMRDEPRGTKRMGLSTAERMNTERTRHAFWGEQGSATEPYRQKN